MHSCKIMTGIMRAFLSTKSSGTSLAIGTECLQKLLDFRNVSRKLKGKRNKWNGCYQDEIFENVGETREVVLFQEILLNSARFATGNPDRKVKPDFLVD